MSDPGQHAGSWTLLTGHGRVLVEIARNPGARIRDISDVVGLTERTVQAIVADLSTAGYLTRTRTGRRTLYTVNADSLFRHPAQEGHRVGPFLALMAASGDLTAPVSGLAGEDRTGPGSPVPGQSRRSRHGPASAARPVAATRNHHRASDRQSETAPDPENR